ncbi:uncharacterized protein G2W53_042364 [Senna tora]|uniref:Uncharacterized protein n=1 Tax=Senna tora TaxID=362788 RepID=A0A834VYX6_9FABA|nr:uncharacterized protein G2W53_042364 [Senna tora]
MERAREEQKSWMKLVKKPQHWPSFFNMDLGSPCGSGGNGGTRRLVAL